MWFLDVTITILSWGHYALNLSVNVGSQSGHPHPLFSKKACPSKVVCIGKHGKWDDGAPIVLNAPSCPGHLLSTYCVPGSGGTGYPLPSIVAIEIEQLRSECSLAALFLLQGQVLWPRGKTPAQDELTTILRVLRVWAYLPRVLPSGRG